MVQQQASPTVSSSPAGDAAAADGDDGTWNIVWCYDGWHPCRLELEKILPPWAKVRVMDTSKPLSEQVQDARVLIPTTGVVDAAAIEAAKGLRLIAQPAAGYANIDVEAAKRRGVPVTIAPGEGDETLFCLFWGLGA